MCHVLMSCVSQKKLLTLSLMGNVVGLLVLVWYLVYDDSRAGLGADKVLLQTFTQSTNNEIEHSTQALKPRNHTKYFVSKNMSDKDLTYEYENTNGTDMDSNMDKILRSQLFGSLKQTMNPICYNNLPLFVEFGSHHKTGFEFSRQTMTSLYQYCRIPMPTRGNAYGKNIQYTRFGSHNSNRKEFLPSLYDPKRTIYFNPNKHWPFKLPNMDYFINNFNKPIILLHFIRSPLNTIISGFNYHSQCSEPWLKCSLNFDETSIWRKNKKCLIERWSPPGYGFNTTGIYMESMDGTCSISDMSSSSNMFDDNVNKNRHKRDTNRGMKQVFNYNMPKYNFFSDAFTSRKCLILHPLECFLGNNYNINNINNNNDNTFDFIRSDTIYLILETGLSICQLYNDKYDFPNIIERLYFEFVRYVNCEYIEMYNSINILNKYAYGFNFKMEDYTRSSYDFDKFVHRLIVDILGLKMEDNHEEYAAVMRYLTKNDLNRHKFKSKKSGHVTRNSKRKAIDEKNAAAGLLQFVYQTDLNKAIVVCHIIKQMTLNIGYQWDHLHQQYC